MQAFKIMHGLWGMGQMMFTKDTSSSLTTMSTCITPAKSSFAFCATTDPQRDSIFTKGPADVLDHATAEMAIGSKLGIDATRKLAGEGFKRKWPLRSSGLTRRLRRNEEPARTPLSSPYGSDALVP